MKQQPYPTLDQFDRAHGQLARPAELAQQEAVRDRSRDCDRDFGVGSDADE